MMMDRSPLSGKVVVGLTLLACVCIAWVMVYPIFHFFLYDLKNGIRLRQQYVHQKAILEKTVTAPSGFDYFAMDHKLFLPHTDRNIAGIGLQSQIQVMVQKAEGVMESIQILPVESRAGFEKNLVKAVFYIPPTHLLDFLVEMDSKVPRILVPTLTLRSPFASSSLNKPNTLAIEAVFSRISIVENKHDK